MLVETTVVTEYVSAEPIKTETEYIRATVLAKSK